ncbi:hypothetical protein CHS0354_004086 [Potamilus streckersoni]|uniref:Uncharacterized protein n=1 Tax=Potamilus streckersoni TaxID=2493646 RepID=A0AAE0WCV7_9BIVA|nr:hypothetical protein CHS0354_004086 [Potamilus streckersoni]
MASLYLHIKVNMRMLTQETQECILDEAGRFNKGSVKSSFLDEAGRVNKEQWFRLVGGCLILKKRLTELV